MGEVIRFVPKTERERANLIREARAIYHSIFPPADLFGEEQGSHSEIVAQPNNKELHHVLSRFQASNPPMPLQSSSGF